MPLLSIITVNYNNAAGLQTTIDSVLKQSFKDFEYIIVDGNSNDESSAVIEANKKHLNKVIQESDRGPYDAMNKGLKIAAGEFVQFLNSGDVFYSQQSLAVSFARIVPTKVDIAYGQIESLWGEEPAIIGYPADLTLGFVKQYAINHQACFCRRTLLLAAGGFNTNYTMAADYALLLECMLLKARLKYLPFPIVKYDMGGLSSQNITIYLQQMKDAFLHIVPAEVNEEIKTWHEKNYDESGLRKYSLVTRIWRRIFRSGLGANNFFPFRKLDY